MLLATTTKWLLAGVLTALVLVGLLRFGAHVAEASDSPTLTQADPIDASRLDRAARFTSIAVAVGTVSSLYLFVATAGLFPAWPPSQTEFYSQQADGFLAGHTHLGVESSSTYWDSSFYKGKNFIYWGPVPALFLVVVKLVVGTDHVIPDNRVAVGFSIAFLICRLFLLSLIGPLFRDLRMRWPMGVAFAVLAFAAPELYMLARPAIYEASIIAAQCFLLAGICVALSGMLPGASARRRFGSCLAAGMFWALAVGCRVPAALPVVLLVPATGVAYGLTGKRNPLVPLSLVGAPVMLGLLGLALFNKVRFDAWTEFGTTYQVTILRPSWTGSFVVPNLYSYLFRPPTVSCAFPFISSMWHMGADAAFPQHLPLPSGYVISEPVLGLVWVAPWFVFGAVAIVVWCAWAMRVIKRKSVDAASLPVYWLTFCSISLTVAGGAAMLGMPLATMRYVGDVATGLSILSVLGFLWTLRSLPHRNRVAYRAAGSLAVLLAAYTAIVGILLGADGYAGQLKSSNPAIYETLKGSLSWPGCR